MSNLDANCLSVAESAPRTLVLHGSGEEEEARPTLMDYVGIFPNLVSINIDLVYPYDHGLRDNDSHRHAFHGEQRSYNAPVTSTHRLKAVSLSLTSDNYFCGTKHEGFTAKVVPQIKRKLQQTGIPKLDVYHLDFATSRTKQDRKSRNYWTDLRKRIMSVYLIPAKEVSLHFRALRMDGEVDRFLVRDFATGEKTQVLTSLSHRIRSSVPSKLGLAVSTPLVS